MDELVRWLGEQLDEDERIARAVRVPHDWHQGPGDDPEWVGDEMILMWPPEFHTPYEQDKHWRGLTVEGPELAAHIAAHDPARVLRETDAKRRMIREVFAYEAKIDGEWGCCHGADEIAAGQCPEIQPKDITVLRLLALPYAGRPGYKAEEWAP